MDLEAAQYLQSLKVQDNIEIGKPPYSVMQTERLNMQDEEAVGQQVCNGSKLPPSLPGLQ